MSEELRQHFDWTPDDTPEEWVVLYAKRLPEKDKKIFYSVLTLLKNTLNDEHQTPVGEPLFRHLLRTAEMVEELDLLPDAVIATLASVFPAFVPEWKIQLEKIAGKQVVKLVEGIDQVSKLTEFAKVDSLATPDERNRQAETMRKMLLAMVSDIRVVLIKLAQRTRTMQFLGRVPDSPLKRAIAKETMDIFAPLANRLGVWQLKWQLEDLGFRYQHPDEYREIAEALDGNRDERLAYIAAFSGSLKAELDNLGLKCEVAGRPKHIYSIYRKMQKKHLPFSGLYDIRAVRVLVETVADCYTTLGIVHSLWQPISGEFDDYISHPKANDYRSLHTVVVGPENKGVEIQIRTFEMHEYAEFGVAAHWRYKEGGQGDSVYEQKIAWLRQLLDWRENMASSDKANLAAAFQTELFSDTIYVLTPQGRVLSLPEGSTPIDFAYGLHSDLGNRCRGAKVNGQMVPLSTPLENGQRVEIIAAKTGNPSPDWLHNGWVKSGKAISKIKAYIRSQTIDSVRENGKNLLEKLLNRTPHKPNMQKLIEYCGYSKAEDFQVALGQGDISMTAVERALNEFIEKEQQDNKKPAEVLKISKAKKNDKNGVLLNGESGLLTVLAKCCKPAPPDEIVGFVTAGRGVSIHRKNCSAFAHLAERSPEKTMNAQWSLHGLQNVFPVDIEIIAHDRGGLLRDVSDAFAKNKINVIGVNTLTRDHTATMRFTAEVKQGEELPRVLSSLADIQGVSEVRRV
ncbi:MAG: bifunctional (p)ppGpp synthetase/guanosine-3',5'-bis(diphosphate) 3'-pyrophosphohydrolase [Neisseriaceae bacterium]|nr:bifunctional (p)ppGpp synthetase/guanosine-3',5'-bis(diphosphate) 3'-pyrophosphohydrolase [Neisseriaceae bacterium]